MTDVRILHDPASDIPFDIALAGTDLATDDGLETAVIISLFSDARASADDELPGGDRDRRGWWADAYAELAGDLTGSKLWLLSRSKQVGAVLRQAEQYAKAALQWLVDDKIAQAVTCVASFPQLGWLQLVVNITRANGSIFTRAYSWRVS